MNMPCSTIKYRPIYATRQIALLLLLRGAQQQNNYAGRRRKTLVPPETVTVSWHLSFCAGMELAFVFLLCGHLL